jgi:hypothetical protein
VERTGTLCERSSALLDRTSQCERPSAPLDRATSRLERSNERSEDASWRLESSCAPFDEGTSLSQWSSARGDEPSNIESYPSNGGHDRSNVVVSRPTSVGKDVFGNDFRTSMPLEVAARESWPNMRRRNLAVRTRNGCIKRADPDAQNGNPE